MAYADSPWKNSRININFSRLEHESNSLLSLGLMLGILFHCALAFIMVQLDVNSNTDDSSEQSVPIILKTVPSPLRGAYRLPKRRIAQQRLRRKQFSPIQPSDITAAQPGITGDRIDMSVPGIPGTMSLRKSSDTYTPNGSYDTIIPHADLSAGRMPDRHINLTDEMLDIDALDTGQYKGLIIRDPADRHNVKGFIYVPLRIYGAKISTSESGVQALLNLCTFVIETHSGIDFKYDHMTFFSSQKLNKYPFLYIPLTPSNGPVSFTKDELANIREYFDNGGFALFQYFTGPNNTPEDNKYIDKLKRHFVSLVLPGQRLAPLPFEHPIFSTYYDVYDLDRKRMRQGLESERSINGVTLNDRLVLVDSSDMGESWLSILDSNGKNGGAIPGHPKAWSMAINSIIYSLIHNKSTAIQLTDGSTATSQVRRNSWQWRYREKYLDEERSAINKNRTVK